MNKRIRKRRMEAVKNGEQKRNAEDIFPGK